MFESGHLTPYCNVGLPGYFWLSKELSTRGRPLNDTSYSKLKSRRSRTRGRVHLSKTNNDGNN